MPEITVLVLNRDPAALTPEERGLLPEGANLVRVDLTTGEELLVEIRKKDARGLIGPPSIPEDALAMDLRRVVHVNYLATSKIIAWGGAEAPTTRPLWPSAAQGTRG